MGETGAIAAPPGHAPVAATENHLLGILLMACWASC
jgi:hypothetical protein